ncbi:MAG: S49 family peptidase [Treponema sp.]|jgi:ClpP class serine protease|nr:S49 family peptidase [Treponema sp.]
MKVWYALADEELDRFYIFREMESRLRADLPVKSIEEIKAAVYEAQEAEGGQLLYETRDGAAVIAVSGTLTAKRHVSDDLYGDVTSYADIERAVLAAEADPLVREIHYHINSPGGYWDGLDCCAEAVKTARKPSTAFVYTSALSGGYYLASQADRILAVTKGSSVGSIGVAAEVFDRTSADGQKGIIRHVLTNRASGDKRPKPEEEAGRELIVDRLDQLYGIFENRVLEGRRHVKGFSAETIRSLAGRTVTAEQALEMGLIDGIRSEQSGEANNKAIGGSMKLADYLKENPEAKAEIAAYAQGELGMTGKTEAEAAVGADRARIEELLALSGVSISGALKAAIAEGVDAGEYAKGRVKELNAAMSASNRDALGSPKVGQRLEDQIMPKEVGKAAAGALVDEKALRDMARKGGF